MRILGQPYLENIKMLEGQQTNENGVTTAVRKNAEKAVGRTDISEPKGRTLMRRFRSIITEFIEASPVEERGVLPVSLEDRTATNYFSYFWIWASMNINLLP